MDALIKPLDDRVFHLTYTLEICKVLLELVAIRSHALQSIVVANVFLVWNQVKYDRLPRDGTSIDDAHEGHNCDGDFDVVLCTNWRHWDGVRSHVARPVELTLLLVHPLPARLSRCETVKLVGDVLKPRLARGLLSVAIAPEDETLARAAILHLKLDDLIDSRTILACKRNLILPEPHRVKLEVLLIHASECFNRRFHLLLELEENVPAETLAQLRELLDQASVIACQNDENVDGDILRMPSERLYLLLQRLFQIQLLVISNQSLLYVPLLFCKFLLLIGQHLLVNAQVVDLALLLLHFILPILLILTSYAIVGKEKVASGGRLLQPRLLLRRSEHHINGSGAITTTRLAKAPHPIRLIDRVNLALPASRRLLLDFLLLPDRIILTRTPIHLFHINRFLLILLTDLIIVHHLVSLVIVGHGRRNLLILIRTTPMMTVYYCILLEEANFRVTAQAISRAMI